MIIEKYLMRQIGIGLLTAAAVLLPLFSFLDLIEQLEDVGEERYRLLDAFYFVLLLLPRRLIQLLPFIALLGNVIALGRMAAHLEITSMRAAGLSPAKLSLASFKVGLLLLLLLGGLEQFAAPVLQQKAIAHRAEALNRSAELGEGLGFWTRDESHVLRIGEIVHAGLLRDLEIFGMNEAGLLVEYLHADTAEIISNELWTLNRVTKKTFHGARADTEQAPQVDWRPFLEPGQVATLTRPPESLSLLDLRHYIRHLKRTGQQHDEVALAFWRKLGAGAVMLAMLLLSVPFVFGSPQTGLGNRLALASLAGLSVYLLDQILSNAGLLLELNYALIALAPGFVLALAAGLWLRRIA